MTPRTRWILVLVVGFAAALVVYLRLGARYNSARHADTAIQTTAMDAYRSTPFVPLAQLREPAHLAGILPNLKIKGEPLPAKLRSSLDRDLTEFLQHRFGGGGPVDYRQWRASKGCKLKPLSELNRRHELSGEYPFFFGGQMPDNPDPAALFDRFWEATASYGEGLNHPAAIGESAPGYALSTSRWTKDTAERATIEGDIPSALWHCKLSANMRCWFDPPITRDQLVARDGAAWCAEFGFILEYQNRSRRPMIVGLFYDPDRRVWHPEFMNSHFFDNTQVVTALGF